MWEERVGPTYQWQNGLVRSYRALSRVGSELPTVCSMASPPSVFLGARPPPCCYRRSRSVYFHAYKRSAHPCPLPWTGRRLLTAAVVEQPPRAARRTGSMGQFACRCSYDAENGPPSPPPDKEKSLGDEWPVLRRWDVPWEWPTISLTMVACAVRYYYIFIHWNRALAYLNMAFRDKKKNAAI
ncbi:hypothetical protein PR202_gb03090 [Eleusine coracana subsp. coracana]|uniref:Uncharacterized protein n=1 Tax=Eleusine coracana subsp. coracana TaxID=191504 RepID=A0AAV5E095_ELECO|nr:hypothetical protein PR202_gb03090 [Eleusine coracana subsp. coracana]